MTSHRVALVASLFVTAVAARAGAAPSLAAACTTVAHAEELLAPGAVVVFGEAHGNDESPRFVAAVACAAVHHGSVRVALELPADEEPRIDAFLRSSGDAAARARLLAGPFWTRPYQDGRSSQAMAELLEALRRLRSRGGDVAVATFDAREPDRDRAMAERLLPRLRAEPRAIFLVLTGNVHARRVPQQPTQIPMTRRLADAGVALVALNAHYGVGTTWACTTDQPKDCGPMVWGRGAGQPLAIVRARSRDAAYDGWFDAGVARFSPPAAVPLTGAQRARAGFAALRVRATGEYEAARYAACAASYSALAAQDASQPGDDWYNAASCFARARDATHAFAALDRAVVAGPLDASALAADADLASLRSDPRWSPLVARVQAAHEAATPPTGAAK